MKRTSASKRPTPAEQDFRLRVALELATVHARASADSRLRSALEKLRQARDEIAALKAEKRMLTRKLAALVKAQQERQPTALTAAQKEQQFRQIFGLAPKEKLESLKAPQETQPECLEAH